MLLAVVMMQAALAQASPAPAAPANPALDRRLETRYQACVTSIDKGAEAAYESAMAWAAESANSYAARCAGLALIEMGRVEEGADRLASVAASSAGGTPELRIAVLAQAANAYLLARLPAKAKLALDRGVSLAAKDDPATADLLIDRARAFAMLQQWRQSEEDLSAALDLRPTDALAFRLRATARMRQGVFDLAVKDAEDAVRLEPTNVEALLVRGQTIEARRTGAAPD